MMSSICCKPDLAPLVVEIQICRHAREVGHVDVEPVLVMGYGNGSRLTYDHKVVE